VFPAKKAVGFDCRKYAQSDQWPFGGRSTKGRAVIACRLAPFVAALRLKHRQFGYCKGLASLLL
jgi:hypothetical protein